MYFFGSKKFENAITKDFILEPSFPFSLNFLYAPHIFCERNFSEQVKFLLKKLKRHYQNIQKRSEISKKMGINGGYPTKFSTLRDKSAIHFSNTPALSDKYGIHVTKSVLKIILENFNFQNSELLQS